MSKKNTTPGVMDQIRANVAAAKAVVDGDTTQGRIISKRGKSLEVAAPEIGPVDVKATRLKTGLSQDAFAISIGTKPATLRNWEQGRREPTGPTAVLLNLIDRDPKIIQRMLGKPA